MKHKRCLTCWVVRGSIVGVILILCLPIGLMLHLLGFNGGWPWGPAILFFLGALMLISGMVVAVVHAPKRRL